MKKALFTLTSILLGKAGDEFSFNGCNDFFIDGTPENIAFVKKMIAESNDPDREPRIMKEGSRPPLYHKDLSGKILVEDVELAYFCEKVMSDWAKEE